MSSTTTIIIQNTQAEARSNVKNDYVHVGLSLGAELGEGASHINRQQNGSYMQHHTVCHLHGS